MTHPDSLECIRCREPYPLDAYDRLCAACAADGVSSNLSLRYPDAGVPDRDALPGSPNSLWRYEQFLPLAASDAVTLGEGMTPMIAVEGFGHGSIRVKDESRNPTWSFKDRLATVAVSWAKSIGAPAIATSSTGNAGAAAAAYAARAGLPCVVLTYKGAAGAIVSQMRSYGAMVLTVPAMNDRWRVLSAAVQQFGWFPTSPFFGPAIGSNPIGIEGYKTLAYEIAEQSDWNPPDWCILPVCYGDALYGMWKGFDEMMRWGWIEKMPRLVAAEISGSLTAAMESRNDMPPVVSRNSKSIAGSIDVTQGTFQAHAALRQSGGMAITLADDDLVRARNKLATRSGLSVETSSAAAFAAVDMLSANDVIKPGDDVVAILTASGLKDFGVAGIEPLGAMDVAPDLDSVLGALGEHYDYHV
ncbi:MAG: pyridoxal-phosphate dependent enzyme [Alphaproteobacteria bacterium]|nr:pyridoxal-phosphate dependent enzyme [Alphaproteobacteria bacterium]